MLIRTKQQLNKIYLSIHFNGFCNDNEHLIFYSLEIETPCRTHEGFSEAFPSGLDILEYILLNSPSRDLWDNVYKNNDSGIDIETGEEGSGTKYHVGFKSLNKLLLDLGFIDNEGKTMEAKKINLVRDSHVVEGWLCRHKNRKADTPLAVKQSEEFLDLWVGSKPGIDQENDDTGHWLKHYWWKTKEFCALYNYLEEDLPKVGEPLFVSIEVE